MIKNILSKILNVICVIVILISLIILLSVLITRNTHPNFMGYSIFRVVSGSMEPEIPTDSLVLVKKTEASEIQAGDVITFYSADPELHGSVNTHRVIDIKNKNGKYEFTTRGDANYIDDKYPVSQDALLGKVVYVSGIIGKFVKLMSNPIVFAAIILVPLLIIFILNLKNLVTAAKDVSDEEYSHIEVYTGVSTSEIEDIPEGSIDESAEIGGL